MTRRNKLLAGALSGGDDHWAALVWDLFSPQGRDSLERAIQGAREFSPDSGSNPSPVPPLPEVDLDPYRFCLNDRWTPAEPVFMGPGLASGTSSPLHLSYNPAH